MSVDGASRFHCGVRQRSMTKIFQIMSGNQSRFEATAWALLLEEKVIALAFLALVHGHSSKVFDIGEGIRHQHIVNGRYWIKRVLRHDALPARLAILSFHWICLSQQGIAMDTEVTKDRDAVCSLLSWLSPRTSFLLDSRKA